MTANDYQGWHEPPAPDYGAPLHDVQVMMPDYYVHPEYYRTGDDECDGPSERAIVRARNNPAQPVWIWRAIPAAADGPGINPGDWVTTSKPYARQHAAGMDEPHTIAARRVIAGELYSEGNSINEWAWWPGDR